MTNSGPSVVNGNLGVWPGTEVTGFPPGVVNGAIHAGDAIAMQAQNDVTIAYDALTSQPCDVDLTGQDLGGMTLVPGVYCSSSSAQLTGILTLDAEGDSLAVWVFQIGSTLTTGPGSSVAVIGGGDLCNVFWQVGSSATLDGTTAFAGNLLDLQSSSLNGGANVSGRILARNGAVTLIDNNITVCVLQPTPTPTETPVVPPTDTPVVPPTDTPVVPPTDTPVVPPTETPVVPPTETPVVAPPTDTPIPGPTDTPIVAPPTDTPIVAPPTDTPIVAPPTDTPVVPPTATAPPILPATGVGPALGSRHLLAAGLGFLGVGLVLFGLALRRKQGT